jgi:hypothetical protein
MCSLDERRHLDNTGEYKVSQIRPRKYSKMDKGAKDKMAESPGENGGG